MRRDDVGSALRLARYFGMTPQFWMNLQAVYDLDVASHASARRIVRDIQPHEAAQPTPHVTAR